MKRGWWYSVSQQWQQCDQRAQAIDDDSMKGVDDTRSVNNNNDMIKELHWQQDKRQYNESCRYTRDCSIYSEHMVAKWESSGLITYYNVAKYQKLWFLEVGIRLYLCTIFGVRSITYIAEADILSSAQNCNPATFYACKVWRIINVRNKQPLLAP
jgi:hypothetical protein